RSGADRDAVAHAGPGVRRDRREADREHEGRDPAQAAGAAGGGRRDRRLPRVGRRVVRHRRVHRRLRRAGGGGLMALEPGAERSTEFVVEGQLLTDVGGTIGASVLSTPGMIAMIEGNAAALAYEQLEEGRATVGFEVCVKHVAAAAEGQTCTA